MLDLGDLAAALAKRKGLPLAQADLRPVSIEKVNVPRIWSLVTCVKES